MIKNYEKTITMELLIFKTNIRSLEEKENISNILNEVLYIKKWSVDYQDCDGVLRIEAQEACANEVIYLINQAGFVCEELND